MKTILFDLDGTLLPMDINKFMYLYGQTLTEAFHDFEQPDQLFKHVMASIKHTVTNTDHETNFNKFFNDFEKRVSTSVDQYIERFDQFYDTGFSKVQASTYSSSEMTQSIKILKEKGYQLIIATNPIFPMKANQHRIQWAGLDIEDFDYISCFEENHYCKPNLKYFEELLEINHLNPEDVLMVGNDAQEDLIVKRLGVKTYLINDHMINRHEGAIISDYEGSYKDFLNFAKSLPNKGV